MANPFKRILAEFPSDSRTCDSSSVALVLALASALAEAAPAESIYTNDWKESLRRLRIVAGGDTPAIQRLAQIFGNRLD